MPYEIQTAQTLSNITWNAQSGANGEPSKAAWDELIARMLVLFALVVMYNCPFVAPEQCNVIACVWMLPSLRKGYCIVCVRVSDGLLVLEERIGPASASCTARHIFGSGGHRNTKVAGHSFWGRARNHKSHGWWRVRACKQALNTAQLTCNSSLQPLQRFNPQVLQRLDLRENRRTFGVFQERLVPRATPRCRWKATTTELRACAGRLGILSKNIRARWRDVQESPCTFNVSQEGPMPRAIPRRRWKATTTKLRACAGRLEILSRSVCSHKSAARCVNLASCAGNWAGCVEYSFAMDIYMRSTSTPTTWASTWKANRHRQPKEREQQHRGGRRTTIKPCWLGISLGSTETSSHPCKTEGWSIQTNPTAAKQKASMRATPLLQHSRAHMCLDNSRAALNCNTQRVDTLKESNGKPKPVRLQAGTAS